MSMGKPNIRRFALTTALLLANVVTASLLLSNEARAEEDGRCDVVHCVCHNSSPEPWCGVGNIGDQCWGNDDCSG